jgi:DNA-binding CsgD family transcriptional regulator
MNPLRSREVKAFAEAVERIHHGVDLEQFPQHIFEVIQSLLPGVFIVSQEFNIKTGAARSLTNVPAPDGLIALCADLIPAGHPAYAAILNGAHGAFRLSDFMTLRELRRTAFFSEIFEPFGVQHEIVLSLEVPNHVAGFSLSRDRDFSDEEVTLAQLIGPQIARAHMNAQNLTALREARDHCARLPGPEDFTSFGLTPREAEVLHWLVQGKRDGEIAQIIKCSDRTVQKHVQKILAKLCVENRTAAAAEALRRKNAPPG